MKRKYFAFLLVLCLILSMPTAVLAAQESRMIQLLQTEPGKLSVILASQAEEGEFTATLDGQDIPLTGGTVLQQSLPITVYCLVDTSGTISNFKMKLIQGTLTQISQSMSAKDQMFIATVAGEITEGASLNTKEEREAAIAAISSSKKDTSNFYAGIVNSLDRLASATDMNPMRVLVLLSDGTEQTTSGYTEQEVRDAIAKTRIPIYAVALAENYMQREGSKLMGSFARSSCGGLHLTTVKTESDNSIRWDATGQEFGAAIWKNISNCSYLTADLSAIALDTGKSEAKLTVTFTSEKSAYSDSMMVTTVGLILPEETTEETTEPTTEETTEPTTEETTEPTTEETTEPTTEETTEPSTEETTGSATEETTEPPVPEPTVPLYVWISIGVFIAAAIVAAVVIVNGKKAKRKAQEEAERRRAAEEAARQEAEDAARAQELLRKDTDGQESQQVKPACYVEMVDIPHGSHSKRFVVPYGEPVTFGRNKRAKYVLDDSDAQLSSLHFSLIVQKDCIRVRDERSTNGTFINGISIVGAGWKKMQPGEKLRAGSREYRVLIIDEK